MELSFDWDVRILKDEYDLQFEEKMSFKGQHSQFFKFGNPIQLCPSVARSCRRFYSGIDM
jgi:hypothetical protein